MKLFHSILQFAINKAKKSKLMQSMVEAPFELSAFPKMGEFTDSKSQTFDLLQGLRSKIKPGWENMFNPKANFVKGVPIEQFVTNGKIAAQKIIPYISSFSNTISDLRILEVGCNSGAASYALAELGAKNVVGSEFSGYKVASLDKDNVSEQSLLGVNQDLLDVRTQLSNKFNNANRVSFVDDDICNSSLPKGSFDVICSWDVLEHLHDTPKAFASMAELLANDGILIHEYNPFFCLNGGHSLCTLDFLWGHTRLSHIDFEKYISEVRPQEKDMAYSFYQEGMNRMAIANVTEQLQQSGLEIVSIIPFVKEQHVRMMTKEILAQTKENYPQVQLLDLVAPKIVVIARKG